MRRAALMIGLIAALAPLHAADPDAALARAKLTLIKEGKATPGSVFVFTPAEINGWAREELAEEDLGIRNPKLTFGDNSLTFEALVDISKLAAKKAEAGMLARLLPGETTVKLKLNPESSNGRLTLRLVSAEIGVITLSGTILNFLATLVVQHIYDDAKVNEPFELGHNIDRETIEPRALRVFMKK